MVTSNVLTSVEDPARRAANRGVVSWDTGVPPSPGGAAQYSDDVDFCINHQGNTAHEETTNQPNDESSGQPIARDAPSRLRAPSPPSLTIVRRAIAAVHKSMTLGQKTHRNPAAIDETPNQATPHRMTQNGAPVDADARNAPLTVLRIVGSAPPALCRSAPGLIALPSAMSLATSPIPARAHPVA